MRGQRAGVLGCEGMSLEAQMFRGLSLAQPLKSHRFWLSYHWLGATEMVSQPWQVGMRMNRDDA